MPASATYMWSSVLTHFKGSNKRAALVGWWYNCFKLGGVYSKFPVEGKKRTICFECILDPDNPDFDS
jgi:hypothetical protein